MKRLPLILVAVAAYAQSLDLHRDALVMDGHVHVMSRQFLEGSDIGQRYPDGHIDLPRLREGGVDAMFFTVYTPEPYYPGRHEIKNTFRLVELARQQIEKNSDVLELALTASDIERIVASGKTAAFLDLEGPFDLEGELLILDALYRLGLRSAQLTAHNYTHGFADSCCDFPKWNGLNDQGRKVIAEMNRLGMVINVAHGSEETILQTVEASKDPVIYTHGGFRHFVNIPRCISDKAAKAIAAKGGVIGLQFGSGFNHPEYFEWANRRPPVTNISASLGKYADMSISEIDAIERKSIPFVSKAKFPPDLRMTPDEFAKVIDYGVQLVGEDHMALGSDVDGGPFLPAGMDDVSDYGEITKALQRLGYSESRIKKIIGGNLLRVIREVTEK